jgi:C-terminal processing protease CtpA/Prc
MYNRTRNGRGRDDFGPYEPYYIEPSGSPYTYTKPVVVLTDRGSYSASTFFALAAKAMDTFTLVGDKTGGGGGLPNGGQLPNGWRYRFSISQSYDLDKINYSEEGVEPEYYKKFNWNNLDKDEILDFAIEYLTD